MPISDLLKTAIDKAPTDFADQFNTIVGARIAAALEDKKIEFAQAIYGEPSTDDSDEEVDVEPLDAEETEDTDEDEDEDLDIDLDDLDIDLDDLDLDGEIDDE
jgi:hypothetical protein